MDGGTTTVCVRVGRRCDVATDGPHSRVRYAGGRWWRWLRMGAWTLSRRVVDVAPVRPPSLAELAASVPRGDRAELLARVQEISRGLLEGLTVERIERLARPQR